MSEKEINKTDILKYLKEHYSEFKKKYNIEQIGLFGSYAKDEATKTSDIDIFVKMEASLYGMIDIKEQIENDLKKDVDIVRLRDKMNPHLKKRILEDGINAI